MSRPVLEMFEKVPVVEVSSVPQTMSNGSQQVISERLERLQHIDMV